VVFLLVEVNLCRLFLSFVYLCIAVGDPIINRVGRDLIKTGLVLPHLYACLMPGPGFSMFYVVVFCYVL